MFNKSFITSKKIQKHSKVHFEEYLQSLGEPRSDISGDSAANIEATMIENRYLMKRRIRQLAERMRVSVHKQ